MRKKIALIGGGQIGQILAMLAAQKEMGDIVVLDIPDYENPVKGKALDLMEMAPHGNYDSKVTGTSDYKDIAGADVVIVTAGLPRKPGMSRDDLVRKNSAIVKDIAGGPASSSPHQLTVSGNNLFFAESVHPITPDGILDPLDLDVMRAWLAETPGVDVPAATCDVNGDGACDIADVAVMAQAQAGLGTPIEAIRRSEDRDLFVRELESIGVMSARSRACRSAASSTTLPFSKRSRSATLTLAV